MGELFQEVLIRPLFNILIFLHNFIPGSDLGFAIIALTILIKGAFWPLTHKSLKSQKALQKLQPKIKKLREEYEDDKEELAQKMMELYSEEKVNPLSSCLPMLVQLPVLFALYRVLGAELQDNGTLPALYSFVSEPGTIDLVFLGIFDLSEKSIILALIAGGLQFFQARMMTTNRAPKEVEDTEGAQDENMLASMNKSMVYFMPIVTVVIGASFPGGLTLYWVAMNLFAIFQQWVAFSQMDNDEDDGDNDSPDVEVIEADGDTEPAAA
jgi:YidC/Oxa1 family membrane protein insertase